MEHVIMMHAKDNIAIVMVPSLAVGSEFTVGGKMVCAKDELPFAHKVAIKAIPKGGQIVKYGEPVGIATANIAPGDAIFFDWDLDGSADHVGLVVGTDGSRVYTVEGNSGDACKIKSYSLSYECIKGYGLMNW